MTCAVSRVAPSHLALPPSQRLALLLYRDYVACQFIERELGTALASLERAPDDAELALLARRVNDLRRAIAATDAVMAHIAGQRRILGPLAVRR